MENKLISFIKKESLFNLKTDKILLAISGGTDSVVLCELFSNLNINFGIAHCNFKLRGSDADADEKFVQQLAKKKKVKFHSTSFNTSEYAKKNGVSIEMAARELRYEWFNSVLKEFKYNYIATGHHLNDQIETVILNLTRGTGIAGLHGILPKKNKIIRPLLFTTRKDIEFYASTNNLQYRTDESNNDTKFIRNKIRHEVTPRLEEINPSFSNTMKENIERVKNIENIYQRAIEIEREKIITTNKEISYLSIQKLKDLPYSKTFLYEFLAPYEFNAAVSEDIYHSLNEISGKQFFSKTHRIIKDRDNLIITALKAIQNKTFFIESSCEKINSPLHLSVCEKKNDINFSIIKNTDTGSFDLDKLSFPLSIRRWQKSDFFFPFGMKTKKKLSDFFIDNKFSIIDKENAWLLCSNNEIVWIIGHRTDNRFRITTATKTICEIKLENI